MSDELTEPSLEALLAQYKVNVEWRGDKLKWRAVWPDWGGTEFHVSVGTTPREAVETLVSWGKKNGKFP